MRIRTLASLAYASRRLVPPRMIPAKIQLHSKAVPLALPIVIAYR